MGFKWSSKKERTLEARSQKIDLNRKPRSPEAQKPRSPEAQKPRSPEAGHFGAKSFVFQSEFKYHGLLDGLSQKDYCKLEKWS